MRSLTIRIVEEVTVEDLVDDLMVVVMMIKGIRMKLEVVVKNRGEIIPIISMVKIIKIR